jgi:hypothetical protein
MDEEFDRRSGAYDTRKGAYGAAEATEATESAEAAEAATGI